MKKILSIFSIFLTALCITIQAQGSIFNKKTQFLKSEDAFQFSSQQEGQKLTLHWNIAENYYLYKKEISIELVNADNKTETLSIDSLNLPHAELHQDEFFGETEIYRSELNISLNLPQNTFIHKALITYQGCTTGFCYPPETQEVSIDNTLINTPEIIASQQPEQNKLASNLLNNKYAPLGFFLLGLGLAFTPCVLPMLPLLSAIVIGANQRPNSLRALGLSFVYVQGMALTYTLLGLIVAAIGLPFQIALQSPYVLITLSVIFIFLALSMFGVFTLQLPSSLQTKLTQLSQQQKSGAFGGVFVMGMIAGLVASPCTSAPLSGALLYVAQTGDLKTGALTLYLLALGMGVPLILITLFGNKILPKSGAWMEKVKNAFGFVMLLLPIFLLSRVFPNYTDYLWASWLFILIIWIFTQWRKSWLGWVIATILTALFLFNPSWHKNGQETTQQLSHVQFQPVQNYIELQQMLSNNPKSVAMLDLYADWCVACKEFEKYTFSAENVQPLFEHVLLLQVDMTKNSPANTELMKQLQVLGLPTIIFFDKSGKEIEQARITGFMDKQEFEQWLRNHVLPTP
ncbi:protein-disulfide reductase DsbD [Canicola haemoglobinophilus]|uniref:Thiol:disulfide interchange protein DsbD n=1 Tax=Canicola haemoglobinophilus TaxID=733 RepID=A0A1V4B1X8_9PAST|nr:protein-disulfide reductase DsbD [Canicola haemoglobinophilus]OOS01235.1 protein-disulfide reductase DsbD [Canicola haemoglobinophilus]STO54460.1 thiol:disulfide interchange protein precursor [Canicola haemoglobinophilus]STO60073.1 thiol:disulfide interchange protein precursor [Canicola haemoglobinophilus]STO68994.1 thiol:disulfide interchange protein precursor [Canicola haemoglobinophilus]